MAKAVRRHTRKRAGTSNGAADWKRAGASTALGGVWDGAWSVEPVVRCHTLHSFCYQWRGICL